QRLAGAEAARDQALARIDSAVQAKAGAEATLARAASQIQEKSQRVESLEEELRHARTDIETRFETLTQAKAALEANLAASAGQIQEKAERAAALEDELRQQRNQNQSRLEALGASRTACQANLAVAAAQVQEKGQRIEALVEELNRARNEVQAARGEAQEARGEIQTTREALGQHQARLAALQESLEQERKHGAEKLALIANAREQMTQEFRSLAEEVIRRHGEETSRQNKAEIDVVLTPLRDRLGEFQQGLASAHDENIRQRAALADQIRTLSDNSLQMAGEAQQLAAMLRGRSDGLGAWGGMRRFSILE